MEKNDPSEQELLFNEETEEDTQKGRFLTFPLEEVTYGIPIRQVREIVGIQKIARLPDVPSFIRGLINLRGKVIPVMDIRARFQLSEKEYTDQTCIIVIENHSKVVGMIVDSVAEVVNIPDENIDLPSHVRKGPLSQFIAGMGKIGNQIKVLLDLDRIMYGDRPEEIQSRNE